MKTYKGRYSPVNPQKYRGDPTNIVFRSLWERNVMSWLDTNDNVLEWQSEEKAIPYISPVDGRRHRYFPDFIVKVRQKDGSVRNMILEVKPKAQTKEPTKKNRITKKYITEVTTWAVNQAKWKAATEYCEEKGWDFKILTEDDIFGKKPNK